MTDAGDRASRTLRLWGGRFAGGPAEALARLSVSVHFDWRLAPYDLPASPGARPGAAPGRAARPPTSSTRMLGALDDLGRRGRRRHLPAHVEDEDVHTALERGLLERLGALGGKLRAGRSRNDQVATDLRLYLRDHARLLVARVAELEQALLEQAERHLDTPAPGMTHLQHAQPVLFAHQLLAHVQPLVRDVAPAARLGRPDVGQPARLGRAGGLVAAARPGRDRRRAGVRLGRRQLDGRRLATATSWRSSCSARRCSACTCPGSARRWCCGTPPSSAG